MPYVSLGAPSSLSSSLPAVQRNSFVLPAAAYLFCPADNHTSILRYCSFEIPVANVALLERMIPDFLSHRDVNSARRRRPALRMVGHAASDIDIDEKCGVQQTGVRVYVCTEHEASYVYVSRSAVALGSGVGSSAMIMG